MRSKEKLSKPSKSLQNLSLSIGNFIRYWGFRRIHGAIWTQLYLSNKPLSCTDLTRRLGLSKALISPALDELCHYRLIHEADAPNEKIKLYQAAENIHEVITHVLRTREAEMLSRITADYEAFSEAKDAEGLYDSKRIKSLEDMIIAANLMLQMMLDQKDIMKLPLGMNA